MSIFTTSILAALFNLSAVGIPTTEEVTCPVGGEKFKITGTMSCSSWGDRTLSLRPISSCDFVTRLPQCPSNGLPMYRDFSEEEVIRLEQWINTDQFAEARSKSRYYLAYVTEQHLKLEIEPFVLLELLILGVWYDPDATLSDTAYLDEYFKAAAQFFESPGDVDIPFIKLLMTYPAMRAGRIALAEEYISDAENIGIMDDEVFSAWAKKMRSCLNAYNATKCDPEIIIESR